MQEIQYIICKKKKKKKKKRILEAQCLSHISVFERFANMYRKQVVETVHHPVCFRLRYVWSQKHNIMENIRQFVHYEEYSMILL